MFAALRRRFGRLTLAICVCSILLPATAESHALWNDDLACTWGQSSDKSADDVPAQVAATTGPVGVTHCPLCHWLRAIDGAVATGSAPTPSGLTTPEILVPRQVWWHDQMLPLA